MQKDLNIRKQKNIFTQKLNRSGRLNQRLSIITEEEENTLWNHQHLCYFQNMTISAKEDQDYNLDLSRPHYDKEFLINKIIGNKEKFLINVELDVEKKIHPDLLEQFKRGTQALIKIQSILLGEEEIFPKYLTENKSQLDHLMIKIARLIIISEKDKSTQIILHLLDLYLQQLINEAVFSFAQSFITEQLLSCKSERLYEGIFYFYGELIKLGVISCDQTQLLKWGQKIYATQEELSYSFEYYCLLLRISYDYAEQQPIYTIAFSLFNLKISCIDQPDIQNGFVDLAYIINKNKVFFSHLLDTNNQIVSYQNYYKLLQFSYCLLCQAPDAILIDQEDFLFQQILGLLYNCQDYHTESTKIWGLRLATRLQQKQPTQIKILSEYCQKLLALSTIEENERVLIAIFDWVDHFIMENIDSISAIASPVPPPLCENVLNSCNPNVVQSALQVYMGLLSICDDSSKDNFKLSMFMVSKEQQLHKWQSMITKSHDIIQRFVYYLN